MYKKILTLIYLCAILFLALDLHVFSATFSGANVPFDSSFHLGLVSGPGTGVDIGADVFYPMGAVSYGIDIEQQVTNSEMEQNINIMKYGLALKYVISDDLYLTIHIGKSSFYLTKAVDYRDSLTGAEYTIDEDTHGTATYLAIAPNFLVFGEYFLTPKILVNNIADGGTIAEFDLNLGHKF